MLDEYRTQRRRYAEKGQPLLWKYIAGSIVEPGLAAGFFFLATRLRQVAKNTIGYQADFVVVVENHAAMAGHTEILQQQVARKDIAGRQIAQRVSIVDDGGLRRRGL